MALPVEGGIALRDIFTPLGRDGLGERSDMVQRLFEVLIRVVMFGLAVAAILMVVSFLVGMGPLGIIAAIIVGIASRKKNKSPS